MLDLENVGETLKDPKPEVERVESLAKRIKEGDILLPKFQRSFVWERHQILELLDSIAKNYPIGSVLLWLSRQKLKSENHIADLEIRDRDEEYPINYLLDGQQRLSTICGALYWQGPNSDSVWNLAFDLREQKFVHLKSLDDPPLHIIRLNKLSDGAKYFRHVSSLDNLEADDRDKLKARAEGLFNRFKDYSIATVTLSDMPIDSVAPIFERINSTGTRLTIVDLMRAATWSEGFDLIDTIDGKVLDAIEPKGFGDLERKAVLRNLSAAAGGGFTAESIDHLRSKTADELKAAADEVVKAYRRATDFLTIEIGAPNARIIPYSNQMVMLADIFRRVPFLNASQVERVKKWFWQTTVDGYFSGWNTGQMAGDLEAVRQFANGADDALELPHFRPERRIWISRTFRANNAHAKMLGLMLSQRHPRDLVNGQKLSLDKALEWSNEKEYHHFFPKAFLKKQGYKPPAINSIANFVLLSSASNKRISDSKPSEYLSECKQTLGEQFGDVMRSNLISDEAVEAAFQDDFDNFQKARAQTLHEHAASLCGVGPD